MKIFLTGGSGFIGKRFIKLALSRGHFVYAVSRNIKFIKRKNLIWLVGGLDDNWKEYLKKVDVFVHLAAMGTKQFPEKKLYKIIKFNVKQSLKIILQALNCKCKNFVIASTSSEYSNNGKCNKKGLNRNSPRGFSSIYSLSKIVFSDLIKYLAKNTKAKFKIMRIFPTYGVGEQKSRLYPTLKKYAKLEKNLTIDNPTEIRDFTNVDYVAKVLIDVCERKIKKNFSIFHVSSNDTRSIKEFAGYVWKKNKAKGNLKFKMNKKKVFRHISDAKSNWRLKNEK